MQAAQGLLEGGLGVPGRLGLPGAERGVALLPGLRATQNIPTPDLIALLPMLAQKKTGE